MQKRKQFCINGHDTFICGRTSTNNCKECNKLRGRIDPTKNSLLKQFCTKGHDKNIVGKDEKRFCNECKRTYYLDNKDYIVTRNSNYIQQMKTLDVIFKLKINLRSRLYSAILKDVKSGSSVRDLGCTIQEFKQYIESRFYSDMTWDNWGNVWQLDHIVPLWKFDLKNREQFLQAVNYRNMQPLAILEHRKKTAKEASERTKI